MIVFLIYHRRKRTNTEAAMFLKDNCIYESKVSKENNNEDMLLPQWLREKQEMIFSQDSIEKIHELGSGEYGSVFKGNLVHGKAVYVNFALNYYFTSVKDITILN